MYNFNTQGKRIREMNNVLDNLRNINTTERNIISQGSSILATLVSQDGDDSLIKSSLLECANQIFFSEDELIKIDSKYYAKEPDINNWIKLKKIDLLKYVPDCIKEVKGSDGQLYDNEMIDLYCCFALLCEFGEKPYLSGNDHTTTVYRSNNYFRKNDDFYHTDQKLKEIYDKKEKEYKEVESKIKDAEEQLEEQRERVRQAEENARKNKNSWTFLSNFIEEIRAQNERDKLSEMINNFDLGQKRKYLEKLKKDMEDNYPRIYGCYYDDEYLLQRTKQIVSKKKISIVTGVTVSKGSWGRINTEEHRENILQEYQEDPKDTSYYPEIPSPNDFTGFIDKGYEFRSNDCLASNIEDVRCIASMRLEDNQSSIDYCFDYLDKLIKSENTACNPVYINDSKQTFEYASYVRQTMPRLLYYKSNSSDNFMLLRTKVEIITHDPTIKRDYLDRYNKAEEVVKYLVYDEEDFEIYYKDFKYQAKVSFELVSSSLTNKNEMIIPKMYMNDKAYVVSCTTYKDKLQRIIKELKDLYNNNIKSSYYCEDYEPLQHYEDFYFYLDSFSITTKEQSNNLINYCLNTIKPWYLKREIALYNSILDIRNIEKYCKLLKKRLKKSTSPLLIWYQSLTSFDNTYQDYLDTKDIIKDSLKYMLVTTGNENYYETAFNNIKNCSYIDIEDPDKMYNGITFNNGDKIYIAKGVKEQTNYITRIEKIYIEDIKNEAITKVPVTRLYLSNRLKDWCYTDNPSNIMVAKLL